MSLVEKERLCDALNPADDLHDIFHEFAFRNKQNISHSFLFIPSASKHSLRNESPISRHSYVGLSTVIYCVREQRIMAVQSYGHFKLSKVRGPGRSLVAGRSSIFIFLIGGM